MKYNQTAMMVLLAILTICCIGMSIAIAVINSNNRQLRDDIQQVYRDELLKRRKASEQQIASLQHQMQERDEKLQQERKIREELREELRKLEQEINASDDEIDTMHSNDLLDELRSICAAFDDDQ
jgi:peptidoglycan hydrolase CwlO-like protein